MNRRQKASVKRWARGGNSWLTAGRAPYTPQPVHMSKCANCGAAERTDGMFTNLTPYSRLCVGCINNAVKGA